MKKPFYLRDNSILDNLIAFLRSLDLSGNLMVIVQDVTRSHEQNSAQWPILDAFSKQLMWPVNGQMVRLSDEEWKDVLTAAFRQEAPRLAMSLNGAGVVMLGQRTSKFSKKEFSDWLEFLHYVAADRGVDLGQRAAA